MRRIIIYGIKPEYRGFITVVQGWLKPPTLNELENFLGNQETLIKQMAGVLLKSEMNEKVLFRKHRRGLRDYSSRKFNGFNKIDSEEERNERRWKGQSQYSRGAQQRRN